MFQRHRPFLRVQFLCLSDPVVFTFTHIFTTQLSLFIRLHLCWQKSPSKSACPHPTAASTLQSCLAYATSAVIFSIVAVLSKYLNNPPKQFTFPLDPLTPEHISTHSLHHILPHRRVRRREINTSLLHAPPTSLLSHVQLQNETPHQAVITFKSPSLPASRP